MFWCNISHNWQEVWGYEDVGRKEIGRGVKSQSDSTLLWCAMIYEP